MKKSLNISLHCLFSFVIVTLMTACATTETPTPIMAKPVSSGFLNEYPTRDRVEYVLNCVAKHGGLNYVNQYACGCKLDKIAEKMSFADFENAITFGFMGKTTGEAGGVFRDPEQAKTLKKQIQTAEEDAENACFVK